jgi:hypothetical protein
MDSEPPPGTGNFHYFPAIASTRNIRNFKASTVNLSADDWEKLVHERGAGSGEQGFHLQIFWNFDDHGEADLLLWIINVWTFIKYWR